MPALYLTEADVERFLDMKTAIDLLRGCFRRLASGEAVNVPRQRAKVSGALLHTMSAGDDSLGILGWKNYTTTREQARFLVGLHDRDGHPLAIIEADRLGQIRTGAASGLATDVLAREDSTTVGIIGTGYQAEAQLEAMCAVRPITRIDVYGRNAERRIQFAKTMADRLGVDVVPGETANKTVAGKEIVITATTSREPLFDGEHLRAGCHLNIIGGNARTRREVDDTTLRRSDRIVCDSVEQCVMESGEIDAGLKSGVVRLPDLLELSDMVTNAAAGRTGKAEITLFKSVGLAIEDLVVAHHVYEQATKSGCGVPLPF